MALTRITKGVIKPNENYDTHNIVSTGIVTAIGLDINGNGDVSGDLNVGGVLTYEDVTSIDSVGLITARNGIDCNGDLDVDGHANLDNVSIAGVVTATTFVGDGDFVDLDVDGHAEFDNISVSGVTTSIGTFHIRPSNGQLSPKISYDDSIAEALIFADNVQARFVGSSHSPGAHLHCACRLGWPQGSRFGC